MQMGIKFPCSLNGSHSRLLKESLELAVHHLHPFGKLCLFFAFLQAMLKAVDDRKQLSDEILLSVFPQELCIFFIAFHEVLKLCLEALEGFCKVSYPLVFFLVFFCERGRHGLLLQSILFCLFCTPTAILLILLGLR